MVGGMRGRMGCCAGSVGRLLIDLGAQNDWHGANLVRHRDQQAGKQPSTGRREDNPPKEMHGCRSVAREAAGVSGVVCGVVDRIDVREADAPEQHQSQQGSGRCRAHRLNASWRADAGRLGGGRLECVRVGHQGSPVRGAPRPVDWVCTDGRSPGSRVATAGPAFPGRHLCAPVTRPPKARMPWLPNGPTIAAHSCGGSRRLAPGTGCPAGTYGVPFSPACAGPSCRDDA